MIRLFETHHVREIEELSGRLWDFTPMEEGYEEQVQKVMVPGCFENLPGFGNYRGYASYETVFEAEGTIRLEFKGVSHFAKVYVDGELAAEHYGSYTPFSVCLKQLKKGIHQLKVEADNAFREEYALDMPNDYMSYGGISRGVVLERLRAAYIRYVHFTPLYQKNGEWVCEIEAVCESLSDAPVKAEVIVQIAGTEVRMEPQILNTKGTTVYQVQTTISNVTAWSMETPVLYTMDAKLILEGQVIDDWIDRVGFRTVEICKNKILLNGKAIRVKGFCRHEDHPQYGCALPVEAITYDLKQIKDMGANSIRTTHYPNDELFLDLCDEMGILVWEENHARGIEVEQMQNPHFETQCEDVIQEMITAHYNHPSIYIWGILNECGSESEYGRSCYQAQYELIRKLDQSRPITSASCKFYKDLCQDLPDVCSWNIYPYWYEEKTATKMAGDLLEWIRGDGNGGEKPFLISEIGAGGIYGFRDPAHDVWSEELQAEILEKQLREISAMEDCVGLYIWQFCDVRVSRIDWAIRRPKSRNNKGVVDEYRRPKMAYHVVKEVFGAIPDYREE